jgi:SAM-dependent methyltransferase
MKAAPMPPLSIRGQLRWDVVRPIIASIAPKTILELGCGQGGFGARLAGTAEYTGVEPDAASAAVAAARITPRGGTVLNADHTAVADTGGYDLVCAFEVLEHIADDAAILSQWFSLVRPGGHLLLSVPADPQNFGPSDVLVGHYRRYTTDELRLRFVQAGCEQITIRRYAWPLGYLLDTVRDRVVRGRVEAALASGETPEQLSAGSGRLLQPRSAAADLAIRTGVAPFRLLQRLLPARGAALVGYGRRPL